MKTKIIALDDHPLITDGLQLLLESNQQFSLIAVAHSINELISKMLEQTPDILVLDLNIKGKSILSEIENLNKQFPQVKILIFSSYNTPSLVKKALKKNINGYLLKDTTQSEMIEALENVRDGKIYIGSNVAVPKNGKNRKPITKEIEDQFEIKHNLTSREIEVIQLMVQGLDSTQIAQRLFISRHTVQSHRKNILRKLELHSAAEVVQFAFKNNLV